MKQSWYEWLKSQRDLYPHLEIHHINDLGNHPNWVGSGIRGGMGGKVRDCYATLIDRQIHEGIDGRGKAMMDRVDALNYCVERLWAWRSLYGAYLFDDPFFNMTCFGI